eukprot:TRINITY_DN13723_c0_g1_i1.p2 TRINITY_DN13723_c0_g1~~TRINITY_DN13723_c0_g1_i1.p2  ORF type:complete len:125 (-),score=4.86 TRINITY_DN13723_c0_g1_i1:118-492(-)
MKQCTQIITIFLLLMCVAQIFADTSVPQELQAKLSSEAHIPPSQIKFCDYDPCCTLNKQSMFEHPLLKYCPQRYRKGYPQICTAIYAPVFCLDGNTYSNCCVACSEGQGVCVHIPLNSSLLAGP